MSKKEKLDAFLGKWLSRKLTVFLVSSAALFSGKIDGDNWAIIAVAYVSIQGFTDAFEKAAKAKANTPLYKNEESEKA